MKKLLRTLFLVGMISCMTACARNDAKRPAAPTGEVSPSPTVTVSPEETPTPTPTNNRPTPTKLPPEPTEIPSPVPTEIPKLSESEYAALVAKSKQLAETVCASLGNVSLATEAPFDDGIFHWCIVENNKHQTDYGIISIPYSSSTTYGAYVCTVEDCHLYDENGSSILNFNRDANGRLKKILYNGQDIRELQTYQDFCRDSEAYIAELAESGDYSTHILRNLLSANWFTLSIESELYLDFMPDTSVILGVCGYRTSFDLPSNIEDAIQKDVCDSAGALILSVNATDKALAVYDAQKSLVFQYSTEDDMFLDYNVKEAYNKSLVYEKNSEPSRSSGTFFEIYSKTLPINGGTDLQVDFYASRAPYPSSPFYGEVYFSVKGQEDLYVPSVAFTYDSSNDSDNKIISTHSYDEYRLSLPDTSTVVYPERIEEARKLADIIAAQYPEFSSSEESCDTPFEYVKYLERYDSDCFPQDFVLVTVLYDRTELKAAYVDKYDSSSYYDLQGNLLFDADSKVTFPSHPFDRQQYEKARAAKLRRFEETETADSFFFNDIVYVSPHNRISVHQDLQKYDGGRKLTTSMIADNWVYAEVHSVKAFDDELTLEYECRESVNPYAGYIHPDSTISRYILQNSKGEKLFTIEEAFVSSCEGSGYSEITDLKLTDEKNQLIFSDKSYPLSSSDITGIDISAIEAELRAIPDKSGDREVTLTRQLTPNETLTCNFRFFLYTDGYGSDVELTYYLTYDIDVRVNGKELYFGRKG